MKWSAIILVACALAAPGMQARGALGMDTVRADKPGTIRHQPVPVMTSARVSTQDDPVRVLLVADRETTLSSTIAAKITMLNASIGMAFKAGQTLVGFDCRDVLARLNMARAELAGAMETHEAKYACKGWDRLAMLKWHWPPALPTRPGHRWSCNRHRWRNVRSRRLGRAA